jgi:ATP-dependent Lon protease
MALTEPKSRDLYPIGILSEVLHSTPLPDGSIRVVLRGLGRARASKLVASKSMFWAETEMLSCPEAVAPTELIAEARATFFEVVAQDSSVPPEANEAIAHLEGAGELADHIAHYLSLAPAEKQQVLEELDPSKRLEEVFSLLRRQLHVLDRRKEIRHLADEKIAESQREFVLRSQLSAIQQELYGDSQSELQKMDLRIAGRRLPEVVASHLQGQARKMEALGSDSPETGVLHKHIDTLLEIPWFETTPDHLDLAVARALLDSSHAKLDNVKERVLEFMAVRKLSGRYSGNVLCFEGPPGVGKTSFAAKIAEALGRKLMSISLGGLHDEAELRGHRKTYVGAGPGRLIQGLINCGSKNPVCLLDELDKVGKDGMRSDVLSVLLEALDPSLSKAYTDHFVEFPIDLSDVLFITTANSCDDLPPALRDRLEIVPFSSYSVFEKMMIATDHLLPKAIETHGLQGFGVSVSGEAIRQIIDQYTNEPGVRQLERHIGHLCRKMAKSVVENGSGEFEITAPGLAEYLGEPGLGVAHRADSVGCAWSIVVAGNGGDMIQIEAAFLEPLSDLPEIRLTGNMGNVMRESAETAISFLRSGAVTGLHKAEFWKDVHIHATQAQSSKEGPSAGLAMAIAIASAYTGVPVSSEVAITGEISLRGLVLPVGGVREKILAAHRLGFKKLVLPQRNLAEASLLPAEIISEIQIVAVQRVEEALGLALQSKAAMMA